MHSLAVLQRHLPPAIAAAVAVAVAVVVVVVVAAAAAAAVAVLAAVAVAVAPLIVRAQEKLHCFQTFILHTDTLTQTEVSDPPQHTSQ